MHIVYENQAFLGEQIKKLGTVVNPKDIHPLVERLEKVELACKKNSKWPCEIFWQHLQP